MPAAAAAAAPAVAGLVASPSPRWSSPRRRRPGLARRVAVGRCRRPCRACRASRRPSGLGRPCRCGAGVVGRRRGLGRRLSVVPPGSAADVGRRLAAEGSRRRVAASSAAGSRRRLGAARRAGGRVGASSASPASPSAVGSARPCSAVGAVAALAAGRGRSALDAGQLEDELHDLGLAGAGRRLGPEGLGDGRELLAVLALEGGPFEGAWLHAHRWCHLTASRGRPVDGRDRRAPAAALGVRRESAGSERDRSASDGTGPLGSRSMQRYPRQNDCSVAPARRNSDRPATAARAVSRASSAAEHLVARDRRAAGGRRPRCRRRRARRPSLSTSRYGTESEVWVRSATGVGWSGSSSMRQGPRASSPSTRPAEDAAVPGLERLDLLVEVAGVAGLVGGLDVDEEQVGAVGQRAQRGVALALVVGVVPAGGARDLDDVDAGEHAEPADEVDGGDRAPASTAVALARTTAAAAGAPGPTARSGWPASAEAADDRRGWRPSARCSSARGRARGPARPACPVRSWGGVHVGVGPARRAPRRCGGTARRGGTRRRRPRPSSASSASMTSAASSVRRVAAGEVDHRAVGADRDQVAAVGDLVGRELAGPSAAASIGRPAGVVAGGVVAEDRTCCRRRCPAACPAGSPRPGRPRPAPPGAASVGHRRPPRAACARRARRAARRRSRRARTPRTSSARCRPHRRAPTGRVDDVRPSDAALTCRGRSAQDVVALGPVEQVGQVRRAAAGGRRWPARPRRGTWPGGRWPGTPSAPSRRVGAGAAGPRRGRPRCAGRRGSRCGGTGRRSRQRGPSSSRLARHERRVAAAPRPTPTPAEPAPSARRWPRRRGRSSSNSSRSRLDDTWMSMLGLSVGDHAELRQRRRCRASG